MCGIAYLHDFKGRPVNNGILNQFDKQRSRGTQGFGLYDGQEGNIVRATTEDKILKWLCKYDSSLILFHHRYPTSTDNTKRTAHPLTTRDYFGNTQYILVHNGHISNARTLRPEHEALGITYQALDGEDFNDSEALLWDLSLYLEGKQDCLKAVGGMAFICLKVTDGELDKMYFGRNTNPLRLLRVAEGIMLSSEGAGDSIDPHILYTWNYKLKRLTNKFLSMPSWTSSYNYSNSYTNRYLSAPKTYYDYEKEYESEYESDNDWETPEVEELVMRYLNRHRGVFELAYDEMEFDYQQIAEDALCTQDFEQSRLYEQALRYLETDSEWLNEKSVSSLWANRQLELLEGSRR